MNFGLGFRLRLRQGLVCAICRELYDPEDVEKTRVMVDLFGAALYGVCWCGSEPPDLNDLAYQRRWRVALFQRTGKAVRSSAGV